MTHKKFICETSATLRQYAKGLINPFGIPLLNKKVNQDFEKNGQHRFYKNGQSRNEPGH